MKKLLLLFFLLSTLFTCNEDIQQPDNILDKEKMVAVLVDIELLEAVIKQKVIDRKYPKKNVPVYFLQVMEKNEITYEQFETSYAWWENNPKKIIELYNEVHDRLEIMKAELPDVEKKENKKEDIKVKK